MKNLLLKFRLFFLNCIGYFEKEHKHEPPKGFCMERFWNGQEDKNLSLDTCEHWGWNGLCRKDGGMWNKDGSPVSANDPRNYIEWNPDQVKVDNRNGIIELITDLNSDTNGTPIVSGEVATLEEFTYPLYVVIRMKVAPHGFRYWNGGVMYSKHGWPPEFDFFEFEGTDSCEYTSTVHALEDGKNISEGHHKYRFNTDLSEAFHLYAMKWEKDNLSVYLDNVLLSVYKGKYVPQKEMYFLFGNAISQGFSPKNISQGSLDEMFPQSAYIDFIEIYKRL